MRFTDIFIKKPVLATVVSLLILLLGLRSVSDMQVRQYPELQNTVITVTTTYAGADSALIQGFVTDPVQAAVAKAEGIDYVTSTSRSGVSTVKAHVQLNFDPNKAMTEVSSQVAAARSSLPQEAEEPVIVKSTGNSISILYISFFSDSLKTSQITDYVDRVVRPKLSVVPGVASVNLLGKQTFAMRVWVDPERLGQHGISSEEISSVLRANNFQAAAGSLKGVYDSIDIKAETTLSDPAAFERLVIRTTDQGVVRLGDVATVTLGAESTDSQVLANGKEALFVSIDATPDANPLDVVKGVRKQVPNIRNDLPPAMDMDINYDSTVFIQESIDEVVKTILEAAAIVIVVILLFMASFRSVIIPIVTIPLSLIGVCVLMLAFGFSINLMTLLAFVLAIGLVVDDAIVVVENVHRHVEEGKSPFEAAIVGAREIAVPVISMTITLAAVYAPIAFLGGLTGALFKEFALTLAGAVVVSGIVALTLSPMMCSKLLKHDADAKLALIVDKYFGALANRYEKRLLRSLHYRAPTLIFAFLIFASLPFYFMFSQSELAPTEDQGLVILDMTGPASANIDYMKEVGAQVGDILDGFDEKETYFLVNGTDNVFKGFAGMVLKPWSQRERGADAVQQDLQGKVAGVPGLKISAFQLPPLPGSEGLPVQFVISTTTDYETLFRVADQITQEAAKSGLFIFQDMDLKFERPEMTLTVDREAAGAYGVTMQDIGTALATMFGQGYLNRTDIQGKSYKVIPQTPRADRMDPSALGNIYVPTQKGPVVPLSSLVKAEIKAKPIQLNQFNQLNSATFNAVPMPGVALGDALTFLDQKAAEILPQGFNVDYTGPSRQFKEEGSALLLTFAFAIVVIFLVLAAQYESFRDPLVIMTSVPLSIVGAMIPIVLGFATLNIYIQVGLVTLIGLITKHGILICEVAREEQEKGKSKMDAVAHAAALRFRPILMTTAAMVAGVIPLTLASGAGAASRFSIGIVISSGLSVGTLFTLFVLPVIYSFLAEDHRAKKAKKEALMAAAE